MYKKVLFGFALLFTNHVGAASRALASMEKKAVAFDMNGVLTRGDMRNSIVSCISDAGVSHEDFRVAKDVVDRALHETCPLCDFGHCSAPARHIQAPHLRQCVEEGTMTYHEMREHLREMISRLPKEDDDYADALDVYIHFITDPGLWACHTGFIPEGGRLLEQAYNEVGHGNLYIFSNMPEELFVALRDKFPDSLGRLPDDNILISSRMGVRKPEDGAFKRLKDAAGGDTLLIDDQLINVVRAEECGLGGRLFLADSEAAAAEIIE